MSAPKPASTFTASVNIRDTSLPLPHQLCQDLRAEILSGQLPRGSRVPPSRELARQRGVSRGTVVTAFERLIAEGYLQSRRGTGTFVAIRLPDGFRRRAKSEPTVAATRPARGKEPIHWNEPDLQAFPMPTWARLASRRMRRASRELLGAGDPFGYLPLRSAVADYLRRSRGVTCRPEQIMIVSGTTQSLELALRLLLQPGDSVWMEDPGYPAACAAIRSAGGQVVPVRVDAMGLDPRHGLRSAPDARAVYLTPAHQFPLGMTLALDRRLAILDWARRASAYILEDDHDSAFYYHGQPVPAMHALDPSGPIILMGSFNRTIFPALRLGYMVVPERLTDALTELRASSGLACPTLDQATLCDFLTGGAFHRHLRDMRDLYGGRLAALRSAVDRYLRGAVTLADVHSGLQIAAHLTTLADARVVEDKAARRGVEVRALHRFLLRRKDINALLLGFAAFEERAIRNAVRQLAAVLEGS